MDCQKLPPLIMFKGKPGGWIICQFGVPTNGYPQSQHFTELESAWVDCCVMIEWVNFIWAPFCDGNADDDDTEGSDDFSAHTTLQVVWAIQQTGTEFNIIPAGYTGVLQVLDK